MMFSWVRRWLYPLAPPRGVQAPRGAPHRARYDMAETNDDNRRHWANADSYSAKSANSITKRKIIRERARYEVANNSYARGIVNTISNDIVGTGARLQVFTEIPIFAREIEKAFSKWCRAIDLADKLRTMAKAKTVDGEAFAILWSNRKIDNPVSLDVELVETDRVTFPQYSNGEDDGIIYDSLGNPAKYLVLDEHPADAAARTYSVVPAWRVIHWFRVDRPGQIRGISDIMTALPLFAQLRRYTLAVIAAAETAADFAGVLRTSAPPPGGEAELADPWENIEIEQRALVTLPAGWDLTQLDSKHPSTTYGDFKREILNEIARCLNMPFNVAAGNSSSYNYSSGRLDHQTYFKSLRIERTILEKFLDRIFAAWLDEAVLIEGFLPCGITIPVEHTFFWDGWEHVDPRLEEEADQLALANHTKTLAEIYAARGLDWEDAVRQRGKELALMTELGLHERALLDA